MPWWGIVLIVIGSIIGFFVLSSFLLFAYFKIKGSGVFKKGNKEEYSVEKTESIKSTLTGKTFYFLGSSVTYGAASKGEAMAEFLAKKHGAVCVKEAISGTTFSRQKKNSYIERVHNFDTTKKPDAFICQLSTNDATMAALPESNKHHITLGEITDKKEGFDEYTTFGAMEAVIKYVKETWDCPIYFYTGSYYPSATYEKMNEGLKKLQDKWGINIIDLYYDKAFNDIDKDLYKFYMNDKVHPTRAGYKLWWLKKFEDALK